MKPIFTPSMPPSYPTLENLAWWHQRQAAWHQFAASVRDAVNHPFYKSNPDEWRADISHAMKMHRFAYQQIERCRGYLLYEDFQAH